MDVQSTVLIAAIKTVTLVLGGLITYFAYKAYRRTASRPLFALAVGFGIITLGTFFAGILDQFLPVSGGMAIAVEGVFMAIGFAVVLYSLYS